MAEGRVWRGACVVGACMAGDMHGRGHAWQKGMHGGGVHGRGWACMAGGHAWQGGHVWQGGHAWQGRVCGGGHARQGEHAWWWWGVCMPHMPPPTLQGTVGQCAGGTHPTGMHSC